MPDQQKRPLLTYFFYCLILLSLSTPLILVSCSSPPPVKALTISEQIQVDTQKAEALLHDFERKVEWVKMDEAEKFLTTMARKLAKAQDGLEAHPIRVRIHRDTDPSLKRFFSFPGTTISVPLSYLMTVEYENELAAGIAFELGNIVNRHLAKKVEVLTSGPEGSQKKLVLFGPGSVFSLSPSDRKESVKLGLKILYLAGYDLRGMPSFFQRQLKSDGKQISELQKKELEFNIREAQRARSDYMPSLNPVVRSADFIKMKKGLNR